MALGEHVIAGADLPSVTGEKDAAAQRAVISGSG